MTIYNLHPAHTHIFFVLPLFIILVGTGVRMSSSSSVIQERDAQRAASAHSIRPGWEPQALAKWKPKQAKPELKHLKAEAEARNKAVPNFRTTQEYVTWLSFHGPEEASAGDNSVVIHVTAFDGLTGSALKNSKQRTRARAFFSRAFVYSRAPHYICFISSVIYCRCYCNHHGGSGIRRGRRQLRFF